MNREQIIDELIKKETEDLEYHKGRIEQIKILLEILQKEK